MEVLFLIQDENMPSSWVRGLNLLPELEKEGIHCTCQDYPRTIGEKIGLLRKCRQYDITFLQKNAVVICRPFVEKVFT